LKATERARRTSRHDHSTDAGRDSVGDEGLIALLLDLVLLALVRREAHLDEDARHPCSLGYRMRCDLYSTVSVASQKREISPSHHVAVDGYRECAVDAI